MVVQILLLILATIFFVAVNRFKFGVLINIANIFSVLWASTLLLNYYISIKIGLIIPSVKVFEMVIIGIVAFNLTYLIFSRRSKNISFKLENIELNENIYKILFWLAILLTVPNIIISIQNIIRFGFSLSATRSQYLQLVTSGRGVYVYITNIIPRGICSACFILSILKFYKQETKYIRYAIVLMMVNILSFGGRTIILEFILEYLIAFFLFRKQSKMRLNYKMIALFILVIVLMSISRGIGLGFLNMLEKYFFEQFSFLQLILDNESLFGIQPGAELHFGTITFGFLLSPFYLFASLFFNKIELPSYYVDIHSQIFYNIGTTSHEIINNNTTSIYPFILDFGTKYYFLGFVLLAIILCFIEYCALKRYYRSQSFFYIGAYIIILKHIIYSPIYYGLYSVSVGFALFFLWIMSTRYRIVVR